MAAGTATIQTDVRIVAATSKNLELFARVFDSTEEAAEALEFAEDLHRRRIARIRNAAVLVKEEDGATSLKDTKDVEPGRGRIAGAIAGGLVGMLGGPVGMVVGALAGAGAGGLAAKWIDMGFSNKFLEGLQEQMQPSLDLHQLLKLIHLRSIQ